MFEASSAQSIKNEPLNMGCENAHVAYNAIVGWRASFKFKSFEYNGPLGGNVNIDTLLAEWNAILIEDIPLVLTKGGPISPLKKAFLDWKLEGGEFED